MLPGVDYNSSKVSVPLQILGTADRSKRTCWFYTLAFALACCHIIGVFHGDVADQLSNPTINAMISHDVLVLIDLGDGQIPRTQKEAQDALRKDAFGLETFAEAHLFQDGVPEDVKRIHTAAKEYQGSSMWDYKDFLTSALTHEGYQFPPGFIGIHRVCLEASHPSAVLSVYEEICHFSNNLHR